MEPEVATSSDYQRVSKKPLAGLAESDDEKVLSLPHGPKKAVKVTTGKVETRQKSISDFFKKTSSNLDA